MPKISTKQLSQLIIKCCAFGESNLPSEQNKLVALIKDKDIDGISNWLMFHSHVKHQLDKVLSQDDAFEIDSPSEHNSEKIRNIIFTYLRRKENQSPKFIFEDFNQNEFEAFRFDLEKTREVLGSDKALTAKITRVLLNAKDRRKKSDATSIQLETIVLHGDKQERVSGPKALLDAFLAMEPNTRKQFAYFNDPEGEGHSFVFDVEVTAIGKINIFCFDAAAEPNQIDTLEKLYPLLENSQRDFELRACRGYLQADRYNCSIFTVRALNEFAKYEHVFDYIDPEYQEDTKAKQLTSYTLKVLQKETVFYPQHMGKINWLSPSSLPTKIIVMGQRYDKIEEFLQDAKSFDLDPDAFIKLQQKREDYDPDKPKDKSYLRRRREKFATQLEHSVPAINQNIRELLRNRLLDDLNQGIYPKNAAEVKNYQLTREQVKNTFFEILKQDKHLSAEEIQTLYYLWHVYLEDLLSSYFNEKTDENLATLKDAFNRHDSLLLERIPRATVGVEIVQPDELQLFEQYPLTREEKLYIDSYFIKYLRIELPNLFLDEFNQTEILTLETISRLFTEYKTSWIDCKGKEYVNAKKKLRLLNAAFYEIYKQFEKMTLGTKQFTDTLISLRAILNEFVLRVAQIASYNDGSIVDKFSPTDIDLIGHVLSISEISSHPNLPNSLIPDFTLSMFFDTQDCIELYAKCHASQRKFIGLAFVNPLLTGSLHDTQITFDTIIEILATVEHKYRTREGRSIIVLDDKIKMINELVSKKPTEKVMQAAKKAAFQLLQKSEELNVTEPLLRVMKSHLLGFFNDKHKDLNLDFLLAQLRGAGNIQSKVMMINEAYEVVSKNADKRYNRLFGYWMKESPTELQIKHLKLLQQLLIDTLKLEPFNKTNVWYNNEIIDLISDTSIYKELAKTNKDFAQEINDLNKGIGRVQVDPLIPSPLYVSQPEDLHERLEQSLWMGKQARKYYDEYSAKQSTHRYHPHLVIKDTGVSMGVVCFHPLNIISPAYNFVVYRDQHASKLDQLGKHNWKFNISIPPEHMQTAIEIITTWLHYYQVGTFKIAGKLTCEQKEANHIGRDFVVYTHGNPEFTSQKWVEMINKIEEELLKAGVTPRSDTQLISNRPLGRFTSYMHESWQVSVPFAEGLSNNQLIDMFENFQFNPSEGKIETTNTYRFGL